MAVLWISHRSGMVDSLLVCLLLAYFGLQLVTSSSANVRCYTRDTSGKARRIYTIAIGHDWGGYEYIDEGGALAGFNHDIIREVCKAAGVDCRTVWEPYTNCVKSLAGQHVRGGEGLMDGWYDACIGYSMTVNRAAIFQFSESYLKNSRGAFYVLTSDNTFDPKNFKNKKIGFMDGWVDDEKCLARKTGTVLPSTNVVHFKSTDDLKDALKKGQIGAAFAGDGVLKDFKRVGDWQRCRIRGESIMSRKDSRFPAVWNEGFSKLVSNGRFQKLCEEAKTNHKADEKGYPIRCV